MDDLISRQAAIDTIGKIFPADPTRNEYTQGITCGAALATEYIKQLPSAQPEPRWIPCSERLPEEMGLYLVTTSEDDVARYIFTDTEPSYRYWKRCVKAWMPLPEPWEGEE